MTKEIWLNLPVKNVAAAVEFFSAVGFRFNTEHPGGQDSACMLLGDKNVVVMLFQEEQFKSFTRTGVNDTTTTAQMLISISAESESEVNDTIEKARAAGALIFGEPGSIGGWMYGAGFADLDGHRWNLLYMDMSRIPSPQ